MGYGLMSSALGWPDDGLGEGGPEQKCQGGPSPYFFILEKFYLLKIFFFGPRGGSGPLCLVPGSVPGYEAAIPFPFNVKDMVGVRKNCAFTSYQLEIKENNNK